ncbi:hypothetical protein [Arthrobacter sp. HS15c]|jgi:uncharacterized membrane protein|uniref:DoxX family protein n=1 Tax=Arthrobacter sp. HS15c TaxID=3230279 RepID=UPI003464F3C0
MPFHWPGAVHWSSTATQALSAAALSALLMTSAMKHFRDPGFYRQVVPDYLCRDEQGSPAAPAASAAGVASARPLAVMTRDEWIALSGLVEAGAAVGLLIPATRRVTATGVAALFGVFLSGHVDAIRRAYGPDGSPAQRKVHTARLPLQVPLVLWAWSLRNAGRRTSS